MLTYHVRPQLNSFSALSARQLLNVAVHSRLYHPTLSDQGLYDITVTMSGLEVAGLALGVIPLILSALEFYSEGISTTKRFFRYKYELQAIIDAITTERAIFTNTMELLLTGIVRPEQMSEFFSDVGGNAWQENDFKEELRDRLGGSYEAYLDILRGFLASLEIMIQKLALAPDGKVRHAS